MIYLASPYSHPSTIVRQRRYEAARDYCHKVMNAGVSIFSPIVYGHQFAVLFGAPFEAWYWSEFNYKILHASTAVWVLQIPGWDESNGITAEILAADAVGIPVVYRNPNAHL